MAIFNDLKKLLFGAKAVTKSAADKTYEAGKESAKDLAESGSELVEKAKDTVEDVGKIVLVQAEKVMARAEDLAEGIGTKVIQASEVVKAKAQEFMADEEPPTAREPMPDKDEIMDDIMAEAQSAPPSGAEEVLELPPLKIAADQPKALEQADDEEDIFDSLKKTADVTSATAPSAAGGAMGNVGDFAEGVGKKGMETGGDLVEKFGNTAEKVGGALLDGSGKALDRAADFTENVGKKVMETGSSLAEKFGETAQDVGETIFEKSGEAVEKAKDLASGLGSKILKAKDDLMAKAEAEAAQSGETADSLIDKMKTLNQKLEDKISGNNQQFEDKPLDTGGSEFSKHDSFWEKADRFAKGDYHMKGKEPKPGELTIKNNPDYKAPDKGKVKGFEDEDGDGDELIDDAIVEE